MASHRFADKKLNHIDYCLEPLGIRVWEKSCQLIAKGSGEWGSPGPKWDLPIEVPRDPNSLKSDGSETLRLTAWQYTKTHPGQTTEGEDTRHLSDWGSKNPTRIFR